jgi:hypothetical protein
MACNEETLPVCEDGGIRFEEVVILHLVRLCGWPPLGDDDVYESFDQETGAFPEHPADDDDHQEEIEKLAASLSKEYNRYERINMYIVLKQPAYSAQGPDVFVLSFEGTNTYLDMYQVKNTNNLPDETALHNWLCTLGLQVSSTCNVQIEAQLLESPADVKAAYTSQGINSLVKQLSAVLCRNVSIQKRYLVIKQSGEDVAKAENGG